MTTGEYLVAHSTLTSGTALEHFMALQIGEGQGETVFASKFAVSISEPLVSIVDSTKNCVGVAQGDDKRAYPKLETLELVVTQRRQQVFSEQQFDDVVIQRRSPSPKVIER